MSDQPATANNQGGNEFGEATAAANNAAPNNSASSNNSTASNNNGAEAAANNGEAAANNGGEEAAANNGEAAANNGEAAANNGETAANNTEEAPANVVGEGELAAKLNQTPAAKKKGLSAAAQSVLDDRMKTLAELKAAYAATFGDDKKAPKAKSYEAFALHKIRKEQGEEAFQAKMKEFIERNQGKFAAPPAKKPRTKTVKFNSAVAPAKNNTAKNINSRAVIVESVRTMGTTAKDLIDSMMSTVAALAKTNTGDMSAVAAKVNAAANSAVTKKSGSRKPRSNKGKTHKKAAANS
jgi:hypothetical protein